MSSAPVDVVAHAAPIDKGAPTAGRRLALALLFAIALVNYLDRAALNVLQVPIKTDLRLSDAQLGALTGLVFVIPYTLLSVPLGRAADRWNRTRLIVVAILFWSGLTCLSGMAQGFRSLAVLRMGVAVGEAAFLPAAYSLLADYFPLQERGRATATFGLAYPVGTMLGLAGGGALAAAIGWRGAFAAIGLTGLFLAPVILRFFREPTREHGAQRTVTPAKVPPLGASLALLWRSKPFRYVALAASAQSVVVYAITSWGVPFYVRVHGLAVRDASLAFGLMLGVGGLVGIPAGGLLTDRLGREGGQWRLAVPAVACGLLCVIGLAQFLTPGLAWSLGFGALSAVLLNVFLAPTYAVTQSLVGPSLRGLATAVIVTACGVLGGGVGPLLTGWISDLSAASLGSSSLRYGAAAPLLFALAAAGLYGLAAAELRRTETET